MLAYFLAYKIYSLFEDFTMAIGSYRSISGQHPALFYGT
jgi:hypothetical protein